MVHICPSQQDIPAWTGKVILRRGNDLVLEPMKELGPEARQNLRMPVHFETFIYLEEGGRVSVQAVDLSCGGFAFLSERSFRRYERFEVVIPITSEGPLLLHGEILREKPKDDKMVYASKFCDLCPDEEQRVREAVFQVQLETKSPTATQY